jgi:hypothetical protein
MVYEHLDKDGKVTGKIVRYGKNIPDDELRPDESDYDLRVGEEGPYTDTTSIRRIK